MGLGFKISPPADGPALSLAADLDFPASIALLTLARAAAGSAGHLIAAFERGGHVCAGKFSDSVAHGAISIARGIAI
jgi:hypothetical protein